MYFVNQPATSDRLGDILKTNLGGDWEQFRAAVAFVKRSGVKHIAESLSKFSSAKNVEIIAGIDLRGTSQEGLHDLLETVSPNGRIIVFHNRLPITFHPKIYLFKSRTTAEAIVGSGNLTEGGLYTNYEASFRLRLDLTDNLQAALLKSLEDVLDAWSDPSNGISLTLDAALLDRLVKLGLVPVESSSAAETGEDLTTGSGLSEEDREKFREPDESPFTAHSEPRAPSAPKSTSAITAPSPPTTTTVSPTSTAPIALTGFVMTLQRTDVGVGQTTRGTSRRSPEIFIPLSARDANPDFWGWQQEFTEDPSKPGKFDRRNVRMRIGTRTVSVNMMTWPVKHDFRLRNEALRSAGNIGDIIRIEKVDPSTGFDYYVEVIPQGTSQYAYYQALCTQAVQNSAKTYGYY